MANYISTFHKTGTVLLAKILLVSNREGHVKLWHMNYDEPPEWNVAFSMQTHKIFDRMASERETSKFVVSVRDPRDVVVSAAYYHCKSEEDWLHRPLAKFGGMTYQEKINSIDNVQDKFLFEMDNSSGTVINQMLSVPIYLPGLHLTSLEKLTTDHELEEYDRIFRHLGFSGEQLDGLKTVAFKNSLFNEKVKSKHVRSGKAEQWRKEFAPSTLARFNELFPDAPFRLGYDSE